MKRSLAMAACCCVCLGDVVFGQLGTGVKRRSEDVLFRHELGQVRRPGSNRLNPIRALLLKPVKHVSFDETPFSEVLDWLRSQSTEHGKVNVTARWRALEVENINEDSPVTLEMDDVTVAEALNEVLDQLSDVDPLTYIGQSNTLKISTKSDLDRKMYLRVYDIQDIFFEIRNFRGAPQIDLENQQNQSGGGGGGSGGGGSSGQVQSIFGGQSGSGSSNDDDDDEEDDDDSERETELMDKIKAVVEPDSWTDNGGLGTMTIINRQLIVLNTLSVHEMLGGPYHHGE